MVTVLLVAGCQARSEKAPPPPPPPASSSQITAAECPRFLAKARATIQAMGAKAGMTYNAQMEAKAVADCVADVAAGRPLVLGRCVLDAPSEDAVHRCFPTYEQVMTREAP